MFIRNLLLGRPDVLEETGFGTETVQGVVSFSSLTDKTGEGKSLVTTGGNTSRVDVSNVDLDTAEILGVDELAGGRAFWCREAFRSHFDYNKGYVDKSVI